MLRSTRYRSCFVTPITSAILLCLFYLQRHGIEGADLSVSVNPVTGVDLSICSMSSPCKTIAYAIQSRNANLVYLSAGFFNESNIIINSSFPIVSIIGLDDRSSTVFDCNRYSSSGPTFSIVNSAVSISGMTFQNCANFNVLNGIGGVGGAVSASGSSVTVSDCKFFNNTAQIGGAIGVKSSSLVVSSCVFEKNTAICPNAASTTTACSAWGGAIGAEESQSVSITGNRFNSNIVNLVLNGVTSPTSTAVGGGGCISVMHKGNVSESRVMIDGNSLERCSVQMFGFSFNDGSATQGIQFGNTYGGAVSLYYGLNAVDSLVVHNVSSAFTNNRCRSSGITGSVGSGGNVYGGCLSVYVGAWNVKTQGDSIIGFLTLTWILTNISGNNITNCSARASGNDNFGDASRRMGNAYGGGLSMFVGAYSYSKCCSRSLVSGITVGHSNVIISSNTLTGCNVFGQNAYGGGMSFAVGVYAFSSSGPGGTVDVLGSSVVNNTNYTISSNTLTGCRALGSAFGNIYGGGVSLAVGAYSYSWGSSNVYGSTTVINTSYMISSNTLTDCAASSSTDRRNSLIGVNVYGGGLSLSVGAYSFSSEKSNVSGSTSVSETRYIISGNTLTGCSASSAYFVSSGGGSSSGANAYGGGMVLAVGAYVLTSGGVGAVSGSTVVRGSSYTISTNTMTGCKASTSSVFPDSIYGISSGMNAYGGGIALAVGSYSFIKGSSSSLSGSMISDTSYVISNNLLNGCSASSSVTSGSSLGTNVYGGGVSVTQGQYCYSSAADVGSTTIIGSNYTIAGNNLTNCSATSSYKGGGSSMGANVYGGGVLLATGSYSYAYNSGGAGRSVASGSTMVSEVRYTISSNTFTGCSAASLFSGGGSSMGASAYGGSISLVVGAYSYGGVYDNPNGIKRSSSSSVVSGSTAVSYTSYIISSNSLIGCSATSSFQDDGSLMGANTYGGSISLAVGSYSYCSFSVGGRSDVLGSVTVSRSSYVISSNTFFSCGARVTSSAAASIIGANAYGGCVSLSVGTYSFSLGSSTVSGKTTLSNSSYIISSNNWNGCSATTSTLGGVITYGANVYGGGLSIVVGAVSYSFSSISSSSIVSGSTTVSNINHTFSINTLAGCSAISSSSGGRSHGQNVYGGGISLTVGAYAYSAKSSVVSGSTVVSNTIYLMSSNTLTSCIVLSETIIDESNGASAFGGAFSVFHSSSAYPLTLTNVAQALCVSSVLYVSNCSFSECNATSSSPSCSGSSNAAGGAVFALVPSFAVDFVSSTFSNSSVAVLRASFSSISYSLGGGLSIFQAGHVNVTSTTFTRCHAIQGFPQIPNVFVSGGGMHVQASNSLFFQSCLISSCSVRDAFSSIIQIGGGALSAQNVSVIQISRSEFRDNSDSSSTGIIFLQQLQDGSAMNVTIDQSFLVVPPSSTPALNISCGSGCSISQQQRIKVNFHNSSLSSFSQLHSKRFDSSIVSLPTSSVVYAEDSFMACNFDSVNNVAIRASSNQQVMTFSCASCDRPFEYALTSSTLNLNHFRNVTTQCLSAFSSDFQQYPYGLAFCSTIVNVTVGFWASFDADGRLTDAIKCPHSYCGCKNMKNFFGTSCRLEPPFAPGFQSDMRSNDNLCSGNRTGVLCGGCKPGFTQSLDGISCISNEDCARHAGWTWTVTVLGHIFYSIYIVYSSSQAGDGLISCLLFYGQMSSFASVSQLSSAGAEIFSVSSWFMRVAQFESISSFYSNTCLGANMGAYDVTAAQFLGPTIVLVVSLILTFVLKLFYKGDKTFSLLATFSVTILLAFSSVATLVFKLVTCVTITINNTRDDVVFIDGTVKCYGGNRNGLIFVVVILCLFPPVFAAALRSKSFSANVRSAVCGAYTEACTYWVVVTSIFRLAMSIVFTTIRNFPSTAALIQLYLCVVMLILMMYKNPYREPTTYHFDILCYAMLIIQFGLVVLVSVSESLGISASESNLYFATLNRSALACSYFRCVPFIVGSILWLYMHRTPLYYSFLGFRKKCFLLLRGLFIESKVQEVGLVQLRPASSAPRPDDDEKMFKA